MYQLINPGIPGPSKETISRSTVWPKCIVRQTVTHERLQCPADFERCDIDSVLGCSVFAFNLACFHGISSVPMSLDFQRLDKGNGVASTIGEHSLLAKWHTRNMYNTTFQTKLNTRNSFPPLFFYSEA